MHFQTPPTRLSGNRVRRLLFCCALSLVGVSPNTVQGGQAQLTVEEERVTAACAELTELHCNPQNDSYATVVLTGNANIDTAEAARLGQRLWRQSQQTLDGKIVDDRPLYWHRLRTKRDLRLRVASSKHPLSILTAFERASRGFDDLDFKHDTTLNVLVTGFDPFGLHNRLDQSNPSGVAALAFDGLVIRASGVSAELQSAMFPVRFEDFDQGMVESVVEPLLARNAVDAIITISMGREGFDLERFPGRRRSASAPDNLLITTGASAANPLVPRLDAKPLAGPEFVEFTLPVASMLTVQAPYPVVDNRRVTTLEQGALSDLARASQARVAKPDRDHTSN